MKCTRQPGQMALSTLLTAALMRSWASETTSLTPRRPRRASLRSYAVQNVRLRRDQYPSLAAAVTVDAEPDHHRHRDDAALLAHLHAIGVDPQILPLALDRTGEERLHLDCLVGRQRILRQRTKKTDCIP